MKIYFSRADLSPDVYGTVDTSGTFEVQDFEGHSHYFYCAVEHSNFDDIVIFDGCDRAIPISATDIPDLIRALTECWNNYEKIQEAQALEEQLALGTLYFVESTDCDFEPTIQPALY